MMRKRCNRRPRQTLTNTMHIARWGVAMVTDEAVGMIMKELRTGLDLIKRAEWTPEYWAHLANGINTAQMLAKGGIGANLVEPLKAAEYSLRMLARRFHEHGTKTAYALEIACISEGLDCFHAQLKQTTNNELQDAYKSAEKFKVPGSTNR